MSLPTELTSAACNVSQLTTNSTVLHDNLSSAAQPVYSHYFTHVYQVICAVGLLGNIFALVVWARSGLKFTPVTYFQAICVADSLVLILHPLESLELHLVPLPGLCQLVHVLFLAVQVFAVFLVLGLSVERYIELCHPLKAESLITHKRTVRVILLLALGSLLCSLYEAYIWYMEDEVNQCRLRHTTTQDAMWTYAILVLVVLFLSPLLLVFVINILLARRIHHRRRNSSAFSVAMVPDKHNMNLSVTFVCLYLAVCEIVYAAVHLSQYFFVDWNQTGDSAASPEHKGKVPLTGRWRSYYTDSLPLLIVDVVALTSYAIDVTIFTLCSKTFRRNIRGLFHKCRRQNVVVNGIGQPVSS